MKKRICMLPILLPLLSAVTSFFVQPALFIPLSAVLLFLAVWLTPYARHRENMWMFLLVIPTMLPMNIRIVQWIWRDVFSYAFRLSTVLGVIVILGVLYSMEELFFGYITRCIWKRQYRWS